MITRAEADAAAARWARDKSLTSGAEFGASVTEFELGFVVRIVPARRDRPYMSGSQVIDRGTGRVSTWPAWPDDVLQRKYREQHDAVAGSPTAADLEVQLRRETVRMVAPSVAAHATVNGKVYITRGAKGDQKLRHHPLVEEALAEQAAGEQVRGCRRHAEMLVCSDALLDVDRLRAIEGQPPLTLDEARLLLGPAELQTFQIREPGDPDGGITNAPCESCLHVLTKLALLPWKARGLIRSRVAKPAPNPDPDRFPDEVASELLSGLWFPPTPHEYNVNMYRNLADDTVEARSLQHTHETFPALFEAMGHTMTLRINHMDVGVEQRARVFAIDPFPPKHSADILADFGRVIGSRLFPIGTINEESVLAIDEQGRIFDLDQAGEWFVADNYLEALSTLIFGRRTHRVRDDGSWGDD